MILRVKLKVLYPVLLLEYNINEARHELNLPDTEGGDTNIVNGTYISIKDVGKQYKIDKNGDDNNG